MNWQSSNKELEKIEQTKDKMHKNRERAVIDDLWPEIETLNWIMNARGACPQTFSRIQFL
jgi:hypothetical protein